MRLTIYLLREGAAGDAGDLRSKANARELTMRSHANSVSAFIVEGNVRAPAWMDELGQIADLGMADEDAFSRSYGAVVFVTVHKRVLAVSFGTGFHAIEPSQIERGFGLRVTANIVESGKIRGAQTRCVASNSRDQKTLLPVDGTFGDLAVEVDEDWLRQLSGKSAETEFATTLAGADSLRLTVPYFSLVGLPAKAAEVLAVYERTDYQERFPFLDQIAPLDRSDPRIEALDQLVVAQLLSRDPTLSFAAPDPFEQGDLDHYELALGYAGRFELEDLVPSSVFSVLDSLSDGKNPLRDVTVSALDADGNLVDRNHPLRSYIQAEVNFEGSNYLLSAGLWFLVRKDFAATVQGHIDRILDLTDSLDLPQWDAVALAEDESDKTAEGSYNKSVAELRKFALLDKRLLVLSAYERLEIADLLTPNGELLCVKAASSSATLSHLIAQAVNSAAAWGDPLYQRDLSQAWEELHGRATTTLDRSDATFVLAIATTKPGPLSDSLFFFTKVQIANCLRLLERAGFRVALARIEMTNVTVKKVPRKRRVGFEESPSE